MDCIVQSLETLKIDCSIRIMDVILIKVSLLTPLTKREVVHLKYQLELIYWL